MSSSNICQVVHEKDIDEILYEYKTSITIVMISSTTCPPCQSIKPLFIKLSQDHPECQFVYVDTANFKKSDGKYTNHVKCTPYFSFYYNLCECGNVIGGNHNELVKVFTQIWDAWNHKINENSIQKQQPLQQPLQQSSQQPLQQQPLQQQPLQQQPLQQQPQEEPLVQQPDQSECLPDGTCMLQEDKLYKDSVEPVQKTAQELASEMALRNSQLQKIQGLENVMRMMKMHQLSDIKKLQELKRSKQEIEVRGNKKNHNK